MGDFPPRVWFEYQRVSRKHVILIEVGSLATLCWWSRRHQLSSWPWPQHQKIYQYDGNTITFHHLPSPTITNHPTSRIFSMDFWLRIGGIKFCSQITVFHRPKNEPPRSWRPWGPLPRMKPQGWSEWRPVWLDDLGLLTRYDFIWYKYYKWYIYI